MLTSGILIEVELSFEALHRNTRFRWRQQDDIANPFGDHRECLVSAVWIIDLDNDILRLHKKDQHRRIALRNLRQGPVSIADLEPYNPPAIARYDLEQYFPQPTWNPKCEASERHRAYVRRMLEDFSYQWRHVLRSRYNDSTFRRLARAIIRIVTLDFQVIEVANPRQYSIGLTVALEHLPRWDSYPTHIVGLGSISIVLCQHLSHCLTVLRKDSEERQVEHGLKASPDVSADTVTYLVLSVREVFLYKIHLRGLESARYTKPEPLFNGVDSPSQRAIEYQLMAVPSSSLVTPIHKLPVELQDMVLRRVSVGPVEAARVGCKLGLGSTFIWANDNHKIERQPVFSFRNPFSRVESQISFDGCFSGLAYR